MDLTKNRTFSRIGKNTLYQTTNSQYGSAWIQDGTRPQITSIKNAIVPTYAQIVDSMNEFKKSQRLIKSKIIQNKLQQEGIEINSENNKYKKKTQFHIKDSSSYNYPPHGLNVGPPIYKTNNMNYGSSKPAQFEIQSKYYPTNHAFSKSFCGGGFKFEGLNTVKTLSKVHNYLNDL